MLRGLIFLFSCLGVLLTAAHLEFVLDGSESLEHQAHVFGSLEFAVVATFVALVFTQFVAEKLRLRDHIYGGATSAVVLLLVAKFLPASSGMGLIMVWTAGAGIVGAIVTWLPDARLAIPERR